MNVKTLALVGLGATGFYLATKGRAANRLTNTLTYDVGVDKDSVSWDSKGLGFKILLTLNNTTEQNLTLRTPIVRVYASEEAAQNGSYLVHSQFVDKDTRLAGWASTTIPMPLVISYKTLALLGKQIFDDLKAKRPTTVWVDAVTLVNSAVRIPMPLQPLTIRIPGVKYAS